MLHKQRLSDERRREIYKYIWDKSEGLMSNCRSEEEFEAQKQEFLDRFQDGTTDDISDHLDYYMSYFDRLLLNVLNHAWALDVVAVVSISLLT